MADFFISYSRSDSGFADRLYTALVSRGLPPWMDREQLEGGERFTPIISREIANCRCFLMLQSASSITSSWVEKEVQYALNLRKPIIPLDIQTHDPYLLLINYQAIDFTNQPFEKAVDTLLLAFRTGAIQHHVPNTPAPPLDVQMLYQAGLDAQHRGDPELALAHWNQILLVEPTFLNGELARIAKQVEDDLRPQRVSRIRNQATSVFAQNQWSELFTLLNGLYELDAHDSTPFALKLLVDGANRSYRAGKWDDEIGFWDQILRWQRTYPHANERRTVAVTNRALEPRYIAARTYAGRNADLARQELQALWQSAPYYGDPDVIAPSLGLTVPGSIIAELARRDEEVEQQRLAKERHTRAKEQHEQEEAERENAALIAQLRAEHNRRERMTRRLFLAGTVTITAGGAGFFWWTHTFHAPVDTRALRPLGFQERVFNTTSVLLPPTVPIPAGPFPMGSDKSKDSYAEDDEFPQHTVTVQTYHIARYPLTVAEYACAVGQIVNGMTIGEPTDWQQQLHQPDHPVVNVTWQEVFYYVQWLSQVTEQLWRMPTEAEWEKAARGADGRIYPYGNTFDPNKGNTYEGGKGTTTAVGSYPEGASPYGVLDMSGNVWEWCSSEYKPYPYNATDGREDLDPTNRVLRGGSCLYLSSYARSAYRHEGRFASSYVGARVVLAQRSG